MKMFFCLLAITALAFACKKDGSDGGSGQSYLSKVFANELLSEEFIYSSDMKVLRKNHYSTNSGQSVLSVFRLFEYEDGLISKMMSFTSDANIYDRREISYNAAKKITRVDVYGPDETLDYYYVFQYDNAQSYKMITYTTNPIKKAGEWQLTTDAQNRVISMKRYYVSSGNLVFNDSVRLYWSDKTVPAHWQLYDQVMLEFPSERSVQGIFTDSMYHYTAGGPPTTVMHTFSQKTYNNQGYLNAQHYKVEVNSGLGPNVTNYNMKYEYIE